MLKKKTVGDILLILVIVIAGFCIFTIARYLVQGWCAESDIKTIEEKKQAEGIIALQKKNPDIWGWIKLDETVFSYPVMFTPNEPQKYLRKNFIGEYSICGLPFMDGNTDTEKSSNWIIYGHHLQDGTMFSPLLKYAEDEKFASNHRNISIEYVTDALDTEKRSASLNARVFAYGDFENNSRLFSLQNITTKKDYFKLIMLIKGNDNCTLLETPVIGRQIVTLATCKDELDAGKGKFVVFAYETR